MIGNKESNRDLLDIQKPLELFQHLKADLDKIKSQLHNLKNSKLSSKLLKGISLKKEEGMDLEALDFSGSRLSQSLRNVRAVEICKKLQKRPEDSRLRLELIEMFLQEADKRSLVNARDAFLLAMLEVETPMISTQKINLAHAAQYCYLTKLENFLKDDLHEVQSKIKGEGNVDTILEKQQEKLQGEVDFVQKCGVLLRTDPIANNYELNLNKSKAEKTVPFGDLKNGFDPMLRNLVFLPLASQNMDLMFDILHRLEGKNPIVGFHQSKMFDVLAQIHLIVAAAVGESEPKKMGFEHLSKAMNAIGGSIKLVGDVPEKSVEKAAVHRFGQLCYTIHRTYRSHNIPIPDDHLNRMQKAVSLLEPIAADPKIQKIQSKLLYVLSEKN